MAEARPLASVPWLSAEPSRRLLDVLEAGGYEARFVGGCVRDALVDPARDPGDLDIATPLPPEQVMERLASAGIRALPTGIEHGTVMAIIDGRPFEITTLRLDVETDGRRARVAFTDSFAADAARRDFTINAMSCDRSGRLFDPFDGRADLAAGRIRFVGDATARIREDYLRILRFFRFHARFGRTRPDAATLAALAGERAGLDRLSGERLRAETLKLLVAPGVEASLALMRETGVWRQIFKAEPALDRLARLLRAAPDAPPIARLASALRGAGEAGAVAERLRLSNHEKALLLDYTTTDLPPLTLDPPALRRLAYRLGRERAADRLRLAAAEAGSSAEELAPLLAVIESFKPPPLPVSGHDLIALGIEPGPALGRRLEEIETAWLASDFKADRASLLTAVKLKE